MSTHFHFRRLELTAEPLMSDKINEMGFFDKPIPSGQAINPQALLKVLQQNGWEVKHVQEEPERVSICLLKQIEHDDEESDFTFEEDPEA